MWGEFTNCPKRSQRQTKYPGVWSRRRFAGLHSEGPDELTGNGVASVFIGDGFFMVAVILSATHTTISSLLWLLLLIPAFFFFGKGFRDVWQARQIRRRLKENARASFELESGSSLFASIKTASGELLSGSSVTERTTRQLE